MKALLIDDERLARTELRRLLREHPDVEIAGEAASADEAAVLIDRTSPDLLLLDVQMPGRSGFDLLESLATIPRVIFTTAHDQHALRAFEVSAVDYLLKPIAPERLARALSKARAGAHGTPSGPGPNLPRRIFVKDGERCWLIPIDEVSVMESAGNYTILHYGSERPLLLRSLNQLELRLPGDTFFRASRQHLLNLTWVIGLHPCPRGGLVATLRGGHQIEVSRRQAQELRRRLSL